MTSGLYADSTGLQALLPESTVYEETISQLQTKQAESAAKRILGKFKKDTLEYHIFTTDLSYDEIKAWWEEKGITITPLNKEEQLQGIEEAESKTGYVDLLRDSDYQSAFGTYQNYFIEISSYSLHPLTNERINKTTIVFIRKMTPEEIQAAEEEKAAELKTQPQPKPQPPAKIAPLPKPTPAPPKAASPKGPAPVKTKFR